MSHLKSFIKFLLAYANAFRFKRSIKSGQLNGQLLIIMYHRVLPKTDDRLQNEEPGMYVTPDTLDMHLKELKKFSQLIHIEEWLDLAKNNNLDNTLYCAITFDDGWADNYEFAFPLLKKHEAPATIYLATDYIGSSTTFWPERLAALLNHFDQCSEELTEFFSPLGETLNPKKLRAKDKDYFAQLIKSAKSMTDNDIKQKLSKIETRIQFDAKTEMLNWEQVRKMTDTGVRIGGHTRSHLRLNEKATAEQITHEITGCAMDIENQLGIKPAQFCYPNGDTSQLALETVEELFVTAVTTQNGINKDPQTPHTLKRAGVHEDATNTPKKLLATFHKASQ